METITMEVFHGSVIVHDGRKKGSRLKWAADTLYIYLIGRVTNENKDNLYWHAMNQCAIRHIPLLMLKSAAPRRVIDLLDKPTDNFLAGLFDSLADNGYQAEYRHDCAMCGKPCISVDGDGHCSTCRQVWNS